MKKSRIAERYRVEHEIGRGGMGRVLLVEDEALNRPLALKKMLKDASSLSRARFIDEARITAQLSHPNIVPVFHLGREDDELFLTMRVVEGQDLRQILMALRRGDQDVIDAYPLRRFLRIFLKICDGVGYAHKRGILHRDLKPSNIMVGKQERVLVMDWGLAKPLQLEKQNQARQPTQIVSRMREEHESESGLVTQDGDVVGTPAYMSPEQAQTDPTIDQQSDVYSLGAILYRLVTGYAPYEGSSLQILKALLSRPPLSPRLRAPHKNISPALEAIILKTMERDREQRYLSTEELRKDLELYLDGQRIDVYKEGFLESVKRFARSYRLIAAALLSIVTALVFSIFILNQWSQTFRSTAKAEQFQAQINEIESQRSLFQIELAGRLATLNADILESRNNAEGFKNRCRSTNQSFQKLMAERAQLRQRFNAIDQSLQPLLAKQLLLEKRVKESQASQISPTNSDSNKIELLLKPLLQSNKKFALECDASLAEAMLWRDLDAFESHQSKLDLGPSRPLIRARAYLRLFRLKQAREQLNSFQKKAEFEPKPNTATLMEAKVLGLLVQRQPAATAEEIAPVVEEALLLNPGRIWLQRVKAELLVRLGQHDQASELYLKLMSLAPLDLRIIVSYVRDILSIHGHQSLIESSPKIVPNMNPKQSALAVAELFQQRVWNSRSLAPKNWGPFQDSILKKGGPDYSDEIETFFAAASLRHRKLEAAIEVCQRVLKKKPEHPRALGILAESLLYKDDLYEAARLAKKGVQLYPDDDRLNYVFGEILWLRGDVEKAIPYFKQAARPSLESYRWEKLARCYSRSDKPSDWELGIEAIRKALARDNFGLGRLSHPDAWPKTADPQLHETFGDLRRRQKKLAQAIVHYLRGAQLATRAYGERDASLRALQLNLKMAQCHEELELFSEAKDIYSTLAETIQFYRKQDSDYFPVELGEISETITERLKALEKSK